MLIRKLTLGFVRAKPVRRLVTSGRVYRSVVRRFVAGESLDEALPALADLHEKGLRTSVDILGESVTDAGLARRVVGDYRRLLEEGLPTLPGISSVSAKPSQLGMDLDVDLCRDNLREVVTCARDAGGRFVRIDMEDHTYVDRTLDLYESLRREGFDNVGVVLQAYLRRTPEDLARLETWQPDIRLCKGAYFEPPEVAFARMADVSRAYLALARRMLDGPARPAFATHDPAMIAGVREAAEELGIDRDAIEFQMLYGIGRDLQARLVQEGCGVRVYVPYGAEWYAYFSRRVAERPANAWFVLRHMLHD